MHHNMTMQTSNTLTDVSNRQRHHRPTSTSEDEDDTHHNSNNEWQVIRRTERKKIHSTPLPTPNTLTETHNRYGLLSKMTNQDDRDGQPRPTQNHKPPPIFIRGFISCGEMIKCIWDVAEDEKYCTKSLANNVIKLNCTTQETYRNLIKYFKENNIFYNTYQLKEERAYRVIDKYLHHSTDTEEIRQDLFDLEHNVRNIVNAQHRITKEPLNLFFVDLEPADKKKKICIYIYI